MNIIVITQSDPFFLSQNLEYLIKILPNHSKIIGAVVLDASPFGKRESFLRKIYRTFNVFGLRFLIYYGIKFFISKISPKNSVLRVLKRNNIPIIKIYSTINSVDSINQILIHNPDLIVSIAANEIFKQPLINAASKGCINLHCSLLPKYRGLMPSFWVLKNNENTTGVTVFFVDPGIDSGPIIVQKKIQIDAKMTQADLIKKTKKIGMEAIAESVDLIFNNNYNLIPNLDCEMTYYSFPNRSDVKFFKKNGKKFF